MRKIILVSTILFANVFCLSAFEMAKLDFRLLKIFTNGDRDNDLLIKKTSEGTAGASIGPDRMVISSDGNWVYIMDAWRGEQKYFNRKLEFVYYWDSKILIGFTPHIIEGDIAYGIGLSDKANLVFAVADLGKKQLVKSFELEINYNNVYQNINGYGIFKKMDDIIECKILILYSKMIKAYYNIKNGVIEIQDAVKLSSEEESMMQIGVSRGQYITLPANDYAKKNNLGTADYRIYFGVYRGYSIWLSSMSAGYDYESSRMSILSSIPTTLFVLVGEADEKGTPIKAFYLPPMIYYKHFDPLLTFNSQGQALLMYVDDETKRAHVIGFDLDEMIATIIK